jgi:hypothetical protein
VVGGVVCAECAKIERVGFIWSGVGVIVIVLLWAIMLAIHRAGLIAKTIHWFPFLILAPLWFFVCVLVIYFRLSRRKRLRN